MARSIDVVRAWKDEEYRDSLTKEQRASLPAHPAGAIELSEMQVARVQGGATEHILTWGCCNGFTSDPGGCTFSCLVTNFTNGSSCLHQ